ncbi:MAG: hypothetical protein EXS16_22080 [Gemmataceae bacterium]|nr:hypothetical protein [Gemmataceae bacterium]
MIRLAILVCVGLVAFVPFGVGSPVDGGLAGKQDIGPGQSYRVSRSFRAGERAAVLALVQSSRVDSAAVNLSITVYDKKSTVVAQDKAVGNGQHDFAVAFWYPPRDGEYVIEVNSTSGFAVPVWVAVK